eukprot:GHVS01065315.1.p1 GENE.GHVS01065315.1~~GHVS01065315.1.p1  ORF type:complete len:434 (+),score=106.78 GHVS01065315.1:328-1629(+)
MAEDEADWVSPQMFRRLVGKGHPEFSSPRQQDAEEFLTYLHKVLNRAESSAAVSPPTVFSTSTGGSLSSCFSFVLEQRLQCLQSNKVRYSRTPNVHIIGLDIRMEKREAENKNKKMKTDEGAHQQEEERESVSFDSCLAAWAAAGVLTDYLSPATNKHGEASTTTRFVSFPPYLFLHLRRFFAAEDWTASKMDCLVDVPEELDLSALKSIGRQAEEAELEEAPVQAEVVVADEATVVTLISMGFTDNAAKKACMANKNSSAEACIDWLMQNLDDPTLNEAPKNTTTQSGSLEGVSTLAAMGFEEAACRAALQSTNGDVDRALEWLFSHGDELDAAVQDAIKAGKQEEGGGSGTTTTTDAAAGRRDGEGLYEMMAFITHIGRNANCGHYVCHAKRNGRWVIFNDCKVAESKSPPRDLGYVYLFKRKDWREEEGN